MSETNKNTDKEKITHKEIVFMVMGILMGIVGGFIGNFLTLFYKELLLENPLQHSISATAIVFLFITLVFLLLSVCQEKEHQKLPSFLLSIWKNSWKGYLFITILSCSLTFIYLYSNANNAIAVM